MASALAHAEKLHPSSRPIEGLPRQASPTEKQQLAAAVRRLYSTDDKVALEGKLEALRLTNAPPMRAESIAALSQVIQEGTRGGWDPRTSTAVVYATQILAAVRAEESIPLLIENIEYYRSPVNSFSLYHYPMAVALVRIGPPADGLLRKFWEKSPPRPPKMSSGARWRLNRIPGFAMYWKPHWRTQRSSARGHLLAMAALGAVAGRSSS